MKKELNYIRKKVINMKLYLGRSMGYLGMINAGMLLFLVLTKIKEKGMITWDLDGLYGGIIVVGVFLLIFAGWVEVKLKGFHIESERLFELQPPFAEMRKNIREIHKEVTKK